MVIGQCIGASKKDQAKFYAKKLMVWAYVGWAALNVPLLMVNYPILKCMGLSADIILAAEAIVLTHGVLGILFWCGALCVWFSMVLDWIVRFGFCLVRYFGGKWLDKKVI